MVVKIKKDTQIGKAIADNPQAMEIMFKHGLHCIGCPMSQMESIEQGAKAHGLSDNDVDSMIEEINKAKKDKK